MSAKLMSTNHIPNVYMDVCLNIETELPRKYFQLNYLARKATQLKFYIEALTNNRFIYSDKQDNIMELYISS